MFNSSFSIVHPEEFKWEWMDAEKKKNLSNEFPPLTKSWVQDPALQCTTIPIPALWKVAHALHPSLEAQCIDLPDLGLLPSFPFPSRK